MVVFGVFVGDDDEEGLDHWCDEGKGEVAGLHSTHHKNQPRPWFKGRPWAAHTTGTDRGLGFKKLRCYLKFAIFMGFKIKRQGLGSTHDTD